MEHLLEALQTTHELVKQSYYTYWGAAANAALYYISFAYIFHTLRNKNATGNQDKAMLWVVTVVLGVIVCPVTAWFIMKFCIGSTVYRRMFWMIPVPLVMGYALARLVGREQKPLRKWGLGVMFVVIISICGVNLYTETNFYRVDNAYKLWPEVVEVCDYLEADAQENQIEEIRAVAVDVFAIQARQYDGAIHMPYGRNGIEGWHLTKYQRKMADIMHSEVLDAQALAKYARKGNYQYLIYNAWEEVLPQLQEAGYQLKAEVSGYYILWLD